MTHNSIFLAISQGGVIVTSDVVLGVSSEELTRRFEDFKAVNHAHFSTFLMEKELEEMMAKISRTRARLI